MALSPRTEQQLHEVFTFSILIKGISALVETLSGIAVLFVTPAAAISVILFFSQGELTENSTNSVILTLLHMAQNISVGGKTFASLYLLSHGLTKLLLVVLLLRKKLWAYPASIGLLGIFIAYQSYQYAVHRSVWMILLTVFDVVVIGLIYHEYQQILRAREAGTAT